MRKIPSFPTAAIFGFSGIKLTKEEENFFKEINPAGYILFARNCENKKQIKQLTDSLKKLTDNKNPLILIDQEGGRVARLKPPHWRKSPPAGDFAKLATKSLKKAKEAAYLNYRIIAEDLNDLGINVNCAPMLDIVFPNSHNIIGDRSFGYTPKQVADLGKMCCKGLIDGGVLPVIKHIPGHGRAKVDSHKKLPVVSENYNILSKTDFEPFARLGKMPLAMTAHIKYTQIDKKEPATLSTKIIGIIRKDIGFKGLIMTDDLSMKALKGDLGTLTEKSYKAGCDIILHCNGDMNEMRQIAEKCIPLTDAQMKKLNKAQARIKTKQIFDYEMAEKKLGTLLKALTA